MGFEQYFGSVESIDLEERTADVIIMDLDHKPIPLKLNADRFIKGGAYFAGARFRYVIDQIDDIDSARIDCLNPDERPKEIVYPQLKFEPVMREFYKNIKK